MCRKCCVLTGLGLVAIGCWALAGQSSSVKPPAKEFAQLITSDAGYIQKALSRGRVIPKTARKIKTAAIMIAAYAQNRLNADKANKAWATLRNNALEVIAAIDANDLVKAKSLATKLTAKPKADAGANLGPVDLPKHLKLEFVMRVFSSPIIGGFGMEKWVYENLDSVGKFTDAQFQEMQLYGHKLAMIGELALAYAPKQDMGGQKTRANWLRWANGLKATGMELAKTARSKGNVRGVLEKMEKSCADCHDAFRF